MRHRMCGVAIVLWAVSVGCGSSPAGPTNPAVIDLTAAPSPIVGGACTGCGAGSTERESKTSLTIRETGGVGGTVTQVAMVLRDNATNAVIAQGSFDGSAITQLAGSSRLAANGSLVVPAGVHYGPEQAGKAATLTYTVRVTDDHGNQITRDLAVPTTT